MKTPIFLIGFPLIIYVGLVVSALLSGWLLNWLVPAVEFNTALIVTSIAILSLVFGLLQGILLIVFSDIRHLISRLSTGGDDEDEDWEDDEDDEDMDEYDSLDYEEIELPEFDDDEIDQQLGEISGRELPPLESRQSRRRRLRQERRKRRRRR